MRLTCPIQCLTPSRQIHVCESPDPKLLGIYVPGTEMDGVATFTNEKDFSFYRNNGYWYLGDLSVWPPITHYRCVLECPEGENLPPSSATGNWSVNAKVAKDPAPTVSYGKCSLSDEL